MVKVTLVNGVPDKIDIDYFRSMFGQNFSDLLDDTTEVENIIQTSINTVYAMFSGVGTLYHMLPILQRIETIQVLYGLLTAWYIADVYPDYSDGVTGMGGMLLKSKSIQGVKIVFDSPSDMAPKVSGYHDDLAMLKTNQFGFKAYGMILGAPEKFQISVRSV